MKSLMSSILKHRSIGRMLISIRNYALPKHGFGLPELVKQVCHEDPPDKEVDEQEVTEEDNEDGDILPVLIVEAIK